MPSSECAIASYYSGRLSAAFLYAYTEIMRIFTYLPEIKAEVILPRQSKTSVPLPSSARAVAGQCPVSVKNAMLQFIGAFMVSVPSSMHPIESHE